MKQMTMVVAAALFMGANAVEIRREPLLSWAPTAAETDHPVNYFVPHLGSDEEMIETKKSIVTAEVQEGHNWIWKK